MTVTTDTNDAATGVSYGGSAVNHTIRTAPARPSYLDQPDPIAAIAWWTPAPTLAGGEPTSGWVPVAHEGVWADDERILINGKDFSYFRGVPARFSYQLQEPFAFGPAQVTLPQMTQFDVAAFGKRGALQGIRPGARVERYAMTDGVYGKRLYAGFILTVNPGRDGVVLGCGGDVSARLALRDKQAPVFSFTKDLGVMVYDSLLHCGINMKPYLGPKTGIERSNVSSVATHQDWVQELLGLSLTEDGNQWTVARDGRGYRMRLKDFTTVHATVFLGTEGFDLDVSRSLEEEPTTIYITGTDPRGQKITNATAPNLLSGEAGTYPFTDNRTFGEGTTDPDTDTGAGVYALHRKLVGQGLMTRAEGADNIYDGETTDAVKALQRRVGLTVTGNVNVATWRALFNVTATGRTLYGARVLPMAQLSAVRRFFLTSNGSVDTANPDWDASRQEVDRTIDVGGGVWKSRMLKFAQRTLDRVHTGKNWVGTMTFDGADLFAGNIGHSTPPEGRTPISRLAIEEGWNIKVVDYDGDTLFHVSGADISEDRAVRAAVDTRFRDMLTVGQIVARNKASRHSLIRDFIASIRRPNALGTQIVWSEIGGVLDEDRHLQGNQWNKVEIPVGQSAVIEKLVIRLRNNPAEFVAALVDKNVGVGRWTRNAGSNPLDAGSPEVPAVSDNPATPDVDESAPAVPAVAGSKWAKPRTQDRLKRRFLMLYSAGQADQPLGRYPGQKWKDGRDKDGNLIPTGDPITGDWEYTGGIDITTLGHGLAYLWIYPDRDCVLKAGQILYPNQAEGA